MGIKVERKNDKMKQTIMPMDILKYKRELMGCAILWVMFYHSEFASHSSLFNMVKSMGYGGVDIFLFLSGMGIFFSLKNNSLGKYIYNRIRRIYLWCDERDGE